jgi:hypothetical protein
MCIHKCYIFRCSHSFFVPGALTVCDLATVALLTASTGTTAQDSFETSCNLEKPWDLEAADVPLPKSPKPGVEKEDENLRTEWPTIKGFSGVCTTKHFGYTTYKIERLCSNCERKRNELLKVMEENTQLAERSRANYPIMEEDGDAGSLISMDRPDTGNVKTPESDTKRKTSSLFSLRAFRRRDN